MAPTATNPCLQIAERLLVPTNAAVAFELSAGRKNSVFELYQRCVPSAAKEAPMHPVNINPFGTFSDAAELVGQLCDLVA
jgi:hypothetical protein